MRLFPLALSFVIVFGLGVSLGGSQDKDVKKNGEKPKSAPAKESLCQKYAKESVATMTNFPYADFKDKDVSTKAHAKAATELLNCGEGLLGEVESGIKKFGPLPEVIKERDEMLKALKESALELAKIKKDLATRGVIPEAKYAVVWDGARWVAKELPKKEKKK